MKPTIWSKVAPLAFLPLCCAVVGVLAIANPTDEPGPARPVAASGAPVSPERGRKLFVQSCAHCHGNDARGNGEDSDGPDLFDLPISNTRVAGTIRRGVPGEMPSFAKKHDARDIADLVAYLRTLR